MPSREHIENRVVGCFLQALESMASRYIHSINLPKSARFLSSF